jgi:hypothetical protein
VKLGTTVNLSPRRVSIQCLPAFVLAWAAMPSLASSADLYGDSMSAPRTVSSQTDITRQVPVPHVSFAKKSDEGGSGGSGQCVLAFVLKRSDLPSLTISPDRYGDSMSAPRTVSSHIDITRQVPVPLVSFAEKSDEGGGCSSDNPGKDKDETDKDDTQGKRDENGERDQNDKKDEEHKEDNYDQKDKKDGEDKDDDKGNDQDRDDEVEDDEQESGEDRHDHGSNERHDHDNAVADDKHDHETEESRHDHQEDDSHAESGSADHHDPEEHDASDEGSSDDIAGSEDDLEETIKEESEEPLEDGLSSSEPATVLELSGIPPDSVIAGDPYLFRANVEYDGQSTPVFSITGLPLWASFDEATGELSGTPRESDVGIYEMITISASDGSLESSLPPFSIAVGSATGSVTLSWTPPTENEDGSPLLDLAGYWIYWQDEAHTDAESMKIDNPGLSTIVIDNLAAGTYEFAMTSFNVDGVESARSNTITRIVETGAGAVEEPGADASTEATETAAEEGESEVATDTSDATPFLLLSGTPPEAVTAGDLYLFMPGIESNGESPPAFAIDGLPHWAGFNEISGEMYGAPDDADIGYYDAITISATDGVVETSLPIFSIEVVAPGAAQGAVTLSWMPPTENEDGSYLIDLAGYWIYWGNNPGTYTEWMKVENPGLTTIVIEDLVPGTWEFAMTSFNANGVESSLSNAVTRLVE